MSAQTKQTCDKCRTGPLGGLRYVCLVCKNFHLCEECYERKCTKSNHRAFHPMQPIVPLNDLYKVLKNLEPSQIKNIYSCPYCGDEDLSISTLTEHCLEYHFTKSCNVRCPICVIQPRIQPNTRDALNKNALCRKAVC
ncbi:potassium channel modulatory factor DEBT-91 [Culex quinquefasciatus]|uniref:RING-type E3 ubiquitin transferase n=1 Tax=Culex quinquefasciatus TaxID=7176 RepID=B0WCU0_CULQU|nr:potassium channel modulatory factor DEBT-91 [Culex quinquefasciatus]|eukprot:XP_001846524.1 potassium channel modulatory factor DEBT-91 [Culex quinquefasciatus]